MITFAQPYWLLAGIIGAVCYWFLYRRVQTTKKARLEVFASSSLLENLTPNISIARRRIKIVLQLLAIFCCFTALARPQYGSRWIDVKHKGIDILFALDTSKSMLAKDVMPNRLERSKFAIMDFVSQLQGDRVGLLPFSGAAYLVCPLTADYHAFEQSLMAINTNIIPVGGTNIGNALKSAIKILNNEANHKILVLITDGEDLEGQAGKAAAKAKEENVTIYTVGVGTRNGELIPDPETTGFIKDNHGDYIKSRLDEKSLESIAEISGGIYSPLGNKGEGLQTIYHQKLALIPKTEFSEKRKKVPIERFGWPLGVAIALLALECLLSVRKPLRTMPKVLSRISRIASRTGTLAVPIWLLLSSSAPYAISSQGEEAFEAGNYLEASDIYSQLLEKDPDNPELLYNSGTTAYKNNLFEEAAGSLKKVLSSDNVELQKKAYYNLGNALYRQGEQTLQSNPKATVSHWEQALEAYQGAIALDSANLDAQFNHDLVNRRLEQLKKQQESKQQQQQSDESKNQENGQEQDRKNDQNSSDSNGEKQGQNSPALEEKQPEETPGDEQPGEVPPPGQQPDEQQQGGSPEDSDTSEQNQLTPAPEPSSQKESSGSPGAAGNKEMAEINDQQMTREEAEKLLQAVQEEDGRLHLYVPMQEQENKSQKDW